MDDVTQQQVHDRFMTLPEGVRATITDPATYDTIERIGLAHELTRVEVGLLAQATSLLMMGFIQPNKYVAVLIDQLTIYQDVAATIAQEMNRDIFNVIKDALKDVHGITEAPTSKVSAAAPAMPQKTGPSSYAAPETVAVVVAPQTMPRMPINPAPKIDSPVTPSPLMATLNVAAMKAAPVAPIVPLVPVMPATQTPESQRPEPRTILTTPQQPMHTISMDQPRAPMMTPPSAPASAAAPVQNMPIPQQPPMNIFEEKLGAAFRIKSDPVVATPDYRTPVNPSIPVSPAPSVATIPTPQSPSVTRTPTAPLIGVVPSPIAPPRPEMTSAPIIPLPMAEDQYRETL